MNGMDLEDEDMLLEFRIEHKYNCPIIDEKNIIEFDNVDNLLFKYSYKIELIQNYFEIGIEKTIATVECYFFDTEYAYKFDFKLFDFFEEERGDTKGIYNILFDRTDFVKKEYEDSYCYNIFYIDKLYVHKEYRGKGYAKMLLNQIEEIVRYILKLNVGYILLCALPYEKDNSSELRENDKKLDERLTSLYLDTGFQKIENKYNYFLKRISDPLLTDNEN